MTDVLLKYYMSNKDKFNSSYDEAYRVVPGLCIYAGRDGSLWQLTEEGWSQLETYVNRRGYVVLNRNANSYGVHRLIAEAFLPNLKDKPMVCHKNDIKHDNRVDNLHWGDAKTNGRDARMNRRKRRRCYEQLARIYENYPHYCPLYEVLPVCD